MRFSIIVPVYNAERYLDECLDSLSAQTFADFEVICINDGSTDRSGELLLTRSFSDGRIHVINKANGGPSSARNDGVRVAQGDYVCFLDADDQLEPSALQRIDDALNEGDPDAVVFGWSYFPSGLADRFVRERSAVRDAYYPEFAPALVFDEMTNPYLRLAVRRSSLAASGVTFDEALRVGEDALFLFSLYPALKGVRLISEKLYRYRLPHDGSIMAEYKNDVAHLCVCDLNTAIEIFSAWNKAGLLEKYGTHLVKWFVRGQLYTILRQPPEMREPLTALVRQMWRANFTTDQLTSLDVNEETAHLIRIVLAASDEGKLVTSEKDLARALFAWRIAEYGIADLAVTAVERVGSRLLEQRHMLLKSQDPARDDSGIDETPADNRPTPFAGSGFEPIDEFEASDDTSVGEIEFGDVPVPSAPLQPFDDSDVALPNIDPLLEQPLVSVIVPVYNVEAYLDQALNSIRRQTLRALEIICVDDGSTDASPDILSKHADCDARIRIVTKPNGGYGSACNRGIEEARGTWIAIVEPDDWIDPKMYESMTSYAASFEGPVDIVKTPYWRMWMPDTDQQRRINCSYRGRIKPASQPFKLTDPGVTHLIIHHPSIWSALYRREFMLACNIRFHEIPGAGWADNPFLVDTLCQAQAIVYLDEPFYFYREETPEKTENMARNSWKMSLDRWHDMLDSYERLNVTDENIRRAHIRRGFTYVGLVCEYHDIDSEEDVRESIKGVFDRMDDELVFSEPNVSPGSKQLYAKLKGIEAPSISPLPYAAEVVKGGVYNVVNTGPAMTFDTFKGFVSAHAKREGR